MERTLIPVFRSENA